MHISHRPPAAETFENVKLTFVGDEDLAWLDKNEPEKDGPEELLRLEGARMFVLLDRTFELEGFARAVPEGEAFFKVNIMFDPTFQPDTEAA